MVATVSKKPEPEMLELIGLLNVKGVVSKWAWYKCPECSDRFKARITNVKTKSTIQCDKCKYKKFNGGNGIPRRTNRLQQVWYLIKRRCEDKDFNSYHIYGGIGIKNEFKDKDEYLYWSLDNGYGPDTYLKRKDETKGFSTDNCMWVKRTKKPIDSFMCEMKLVLIRVSLTTLTIYFNDFIKLNDKEITRPYLIDKIRDDNNYANVTAITKTDTGLYFMILVHENPKELKNIIAFISEKKRFKGRVKRNLLKQLRNLKKELLNG